MTTPTKEQVIDLLRAWINQRPGLEFANYGDRSNYFSEYRRIVQQKNDAVRLLNAVEYSTITAENIMESTRAFSGRLQIVERKDAPGEFKIEYCTGQYWPTEYRAAACAVLSSALWNYHREDCHSEHIGNELRAKLRRIFGASIARRWFD